MAVSVRMDPLLEKQLEQEARRKGITKSQFIIEAVERALGRRNPYDLLLQVEAEMDQALARDPALASAARAFAAEPPAPYDTERSRAELIVRLRAKHGLGAD